MIKQSLYETIENSIDKDSGKLPRGFSIDDDSYAPNKIMFAAGAMDGAGFYQHYTVKELKKEAEKVVKRIKKHLQTSDKSCVDEIQTILAGARTISIVDAILQNIRKNHKEVDAQKLIEFAYNLAKTSDNTELVKLGISLLGLFDLGKHEGFRGVAAVLSLYDEFTLFSVVAASNWTDGNELIFWIAKRVDGWGKIHAVERLKPETDEIRDWILREGCSNYVMDAYLGLTCAAKGDLISVLRQDTIDDELFESVAIIIDALLDEGPGDGINAYDYAEEAISLFMGHAKTRAVNLKHLWQILNVRSFTEDSGLSNKAEIVEQCTAIASNPVWKEKIMATINQCDEENFFYACNTATRMELDISDDLFAVVKKEPLKHCSYMPQLFKNSDMATELIELCETTLPLDEMAEGMGDYLFADKLGQEHWCLDFVLPELTAYPMRGIKLIQTGLNSPVIRGRHMACRALSGWVRMRGKPLVEISPELYSEIVRIYEIEVNDNIKETMKKLMDGEAGDE